LSHRLRPYGIAPRTLRIGNATPKGYRRADLHDAWQRYLPGALLQPANGATSATANTTPSAVADVADVLLLDGNGGNDAEEATEL
jgi:hypothetical protein